MKNIDIALNEGERGHGQRGEKKKYFCFSELLGAKGEGKERLVEEESSREMN